MIETEIKFLGSRSFAHYAIEALGLLDDPNFNPILRAEQKEAALANGTAEPEQGFMATYVTPLTEWMPLFDGETLDGWIGNTGHWTVEDGCLVGRAGKAVADHGVVEDVDVALAVGGNAGPGVVEHQVCPHLFLVHGAGR